MSDLTCFFTFDSQLYQQPRFRVRRRYKKLETSIHRVLVVEDFEPFQQFVCSTLEKNSQLDVICRVSDGLDAVQQARRIRPDLIVIDVGLPKLNGIEAVRQIRETAPNSKVLFLSQNSDADVVQRAFEVGGNGYVLKTKAATDLLPAVEAVIRGHSFLSSGLADFNDLANPANRGPRHHRLVPHTENDASYRHQVEFHASEDSLLGSFVRFIQTALTAGNAVIVVLSKVHGKRLRQRLLADNIVNDATIEQRRYISLDAEEILSAFMVNDLPDRDNFFKLVEDLIATAKAATGNAASVAVCGECASILWTQGKLDAAIQLECFCNEIAQSHKMDILCSYLLNISSEEEQNEICERLGAEKLLMRIN